MDGESNVSTETQALLPVKADAGQPALQQAINLWAGSTTTLGSARRNDLVRDKRRAVEQFFLFVGKQPGDITPLDVKDWQTRLEAQGLRPGTIYVRVSFLSSFYNWAMRDPVLSQYVRSNPAHLARPRAPKAYQTDSVKSFTDEELTTLIEFVCAKANSNSDLVAKRDYALLRLYLATGLRREEVISLRGRDINVTDERIVLASRVKGGNYRAKEVRDPEVRDALLNYLTAAKRLHVLKTDAPLWTRHDNPKLAGEPLTSHAFARNLKLYARVAGLGNVHLHQTRHTFGRIVSEETGSISMTHDALDHRNRETTKVYVQRIAIKRDLYSERVAARMRRKKEDAA